jgi:hypothetical protein
MADEVEKTQAVNESAAQDAAKTETQAAEEERFDTEYVRKLRSEAAEYRKKLRDLEAKVRTDEEAKLSESERLQKRLAELERQQSEWERDRQERTLQYEVKLAAAQLGIVDPDAAWRLLDLKEVDFDDDGKPKNVDVVLKKLIQQKPYLASALTARDAGAGSGSTQHVASANINDWIRKASGR